MEQAFNGFQVFIDLTPFVLMCGQHFPFGVGDAEQMQPGSCRIQQSVFTAIVGRGDGCGRFLGGLFFKKTGFSFWIQLKREITFGRQNVGIQKCGAQKLLQLFYGLFEGKIFDLVAGLVAKIESDVQSFFQLHGAEINIFQTLRRVYGRFAQGTFEQLPGSKGRAECGKELSRGNHHIWNQTVFCAFEF